jgi:PLP dependent protein
MDYLKDNFEDVQAKINLACQKSNREVQDVTLIWVSKNHPKEAVEAALELGAYHFGENRVQEALKKFSEDVSDQYVKHEVHIIGPLQSNKIRKAVQVADWIHTVSSLKHLQKINEVALELNKNINVLFQVNTTDEDSKSGLNLVEMEGFLDELTKLSNINYRGLMTIGINTGDAEDSRNFFKAIQTLQKSFLNKKVHFSEFNQLSMGMSGDLEVAIEQGSTLIRIGTALFGRRDYSERGY